MKAIMISIKPEFVADILNGKKTIEIRKSIPKCDLPIDVYIYCTKGKSIFKSFGSPARSVYTTLKMGTTFYDMKANGKVVAKFTLNKVEELRPFFHWCKELEKATCLTHDDVLDYLDSKDKFVGNPKRQGKVYAWHIDNLIPFDKPKEISEFGRVVLEPRFFNGGEYYEEEKYQLTRAPESWCYIEV